MSDTVTFSSEGDLPEKKRADELIPTAVAEVEVKKRGERTARAAYKMMIAGASDVEIADQLAYVTPGQARAAWEMVMGQTFDNQMDYRAARNVATARLTSLMKSLAPRALSEWEYIDDPKDPQKRKKVRNEEHIAYSQQYLRTLDRLIRLQGLDAPQVLQLVTPSVQEMESVIAALTKQANGEADEEGDIFAEDENGDYVAESELKKDDDDE